MAERLILVGRVAGAFGVKGEVRITTYTEDPMALVRYRVLLHEDGGTALTLTGATTRAMSEQSAIQPTYLIESLLDLVSPLTRNT